MLEDARVFGAYSSAAGVTVCECRAIRALLLGVVAMHDADAAARLAASRKIRWPNPDVWPEGPPRTLAAVFAILATEGDEARVGALGQSWLDSGILPQCLDESLRPIFKILVDSRKESGAPS